MNKYKEYTGFRKDNEALLSLLKKNNSAIYDYFLDGFKILGHIELLSDRGEVDRDLEEIFDSVFPFVYSQFELIKACYFNNLDRNFDKMRKYEKLLVYYLFIEDLLMALEEEKKYSKYLPKVEAIQDELGDLIDKQKPTSGALDYFNNKLEEIAIKDRPLTLNEIIGYICDELNL